MDTPEEEFDVLEFIKEFCDGDMRAEINRRVKEIAGLIRADVLRRGRDHTSKGEVVIKLKMSGKLEGTQTVALDMTYDVERKEPKPVNGSELFFVDRKANLLKTMKQEDLDLPMTGMPIRN